MQKLIMLFGFAVLILGAGLLAGQKIQSSLASDSPAASSTAGKSACENGQTACVAPVSLLVDEFPFEPEMFHVPRAESLILPVSHQKTLEGDFQLAESSQDVASADVPKPDDSATKKIRSLIQRRFPDASPEAVNVWTEVCAEMDPSEVEFILEQKRALSETLDAPVSGITISPAPASPGSPAERVDADLNSPSNVALAVATVQRNLDNAWSAGFRRTLVLPTSATGFQTVSGDLSGAASPTMFFDFAAGRLISSPMPLHVAIQNNPTWMFRLEGDRLTRRGDFQLLPDRRIGLMISGTACAVMNSPVIPEDARRPFITETGRINYTSVSNVITSVGQLQLVNVAELDQLESTDGIHFTSRAAESLKDVSPDESSLAIGMLELSNVNREEETALRNHLQGK
jgi:flagellar basal body rod protein FlgG